MFSLSVAKLRRVIAIATGLKLFFLRAIILSICRIIGIETLFEAFNLNKNLDTVQTCLAIA